jgi:outer membrane protein OmpA-like peptidoglycan-associated protein
MKPKKESYFWTSYSDLMTSLFFVMLVLFVLVIVLLHKRMEATEQQLNAIKEVVNSTKELQNSSFFSYRDAYKKYILNIKCQFPVNGYDIDMLSKSTQDSLKAAGNVIIDFLEKHRDTQYIVIIEGQASMNSTKWTEHNYNLSFQRAKSLVEFWYGTGVTFEDNCELQISGSGDGRLNINSMRDSWEPNNQRFLIYIIPKNIIQENADK